MAWVLLQAVTASISEALMPTLQTTGYIDPFLHVSMWQGETIFCESDAMVMTEGALDLIGVVQGGITRRPCVDLPMVNPYRCID